MKFLLQLIFFNFLFCFSNAQIPGTVDYSKPVDIKNGKGTVIARMTIVPGLRSGICLKNYSQNKDSSGAYVTEYKFVRPGHVQTNNVMIVLQFDKSFKDILFSTEGEASDIRTTIGSNKSGASFAVSALEPDVVIVIKVISKKPALATITGISGQVPGI